MLRYYYTQRLKHALRFRTKRGYGVHSPYMFNLIMNVLRDRRRTPFRYPTERVSLSHRDRKLFRLTYRLNLFLHNDKLYASGKRATLLRDYLSGGRGVEVLDGEGASQGVGRVESGRGAIKGVEVCSDLGEFAELAEFSFLWLDSGSGKGKKRGKRGKKDRKRMVMNGDGIGEANDSVGAGERRNDAESEESKEMVEARICEWAERRDGHHTVLITEINRDATQQRLWKRLSEMATVRIEMLWFGLLIFDPKLQPGTYHLLP